MVDTGTGWNGKRYWLAAEPYPAAANTLENPSIWCSDDGQTWTVPAGATNPVVPWSTINGDYNSDGDLTIHDGTAYLIWRNYGATTRIKVVTSTDGVNWTAEQTLLSTNPAVSDPSSPAVVFDGSTWHMWAVDTKQRPRTLLHYTSADILGPWSAPSTTDMVAPVGKDIWHLDAQLRDGVFFALVTCNNDGTTQGGELWMFTSTDGEHWTREEAPTMVGNGSPGAWDASLYRATMQPITGGWAIWYGSASGPSGWRVGDAERHVI